MYTEDYVMEEVKKLQYLYALKKEIRYAQKREDNDPTESVAEHIYGMHILASYFLPLENPGLDWDKGKILEMITFHDIDEIETGDMIGYLKTASMRSGEVDTMQKVCEKMPVHMQGNVKGLVDGYDKQDVVEVRFVKALDKFEPLIHLYNQTGRKLLNELMTTVSDSRRIKEPYFREFTVINTYFSIIHKKMEREGYFLE